MRGRQDCLLEAELEAVAGKGWQHGLGLPSGREGGEIVLIHRTANIGHCRCMGSLAIGWSACVWQVKVEGVV